jgi:hypothetical protein
MLATTVSAQPNASSHLANITKDLLQGIPGITEKDTKRLLDDISVQIRFSIHQMANDLRRQMGYSKEYARVTAYQIVPKPMFYSLLMRLRSEGPDALLYPGLTVTQRRYFLYRQVAAETTVYLFDQTIDQYNANCESTAVQKTIDRATKQLPADSNWYLSALEKLFDLSALPKQIQIESLPSDLQAFSLLIPYIVQLRETGIPADEIFDLLYTVSDVVTNEHLAQLSYSAGNYASYGFERYNNLTEFSSGWVNYGSDFDSPQHAMARALIRSEGHFLVVTNHYLLHRTNEVKGASTVASRPLRDILKQTPQVIRLVRFVESIVRVADDMGDLPIDKKTQAPNIFLSTGAVKDHFIELAGIADFDPELATSIRSGLDNPESGPHILKLLTTIEERAYKQITANQVDCPADLMLLVKIIQSIIYGSKVNGFYNDEIAENIGLHITTQ